MHNINTKEYWEKRFKTGSWTKHGEIQTKEYAKANVKNMNYDRSFSGTIVDFGCALGDAIPIYLDFFPKAKLFGIDISESAISTCKRKFEEKAIFIAGDIKNIPDSDIIIASHVMEHLSNDIEIVKKLLKKCKNLFVFVPYKEFPLYFEHVNQYDENYYNKFHVLNKKIFEVKYSRKLSFIQLIRNFIKFKIRFQDDVSKEIIMYHIVND